MLKSEVFVTIKGCLRKQLTQNCEYEHFSKQYTNIIHQQQIIYLLISELYKLQNCNFGAEILEAFLWGFQG